MLPSLALSHPASHHNHKNNHPSPPHHPLPTPWHLTHAFSLGPEPPGRTHRHQKTSYATLPIHATHFDYAPYRTLSIPFPTSRIDELLLKNCPYPLCSALDYSQARFLERDGYRANLAEAALVWKHQEGDQPANAIPKAKGILLVHAATSSSPSQTHSLLQPLALRPLLSKLLVSL